MVTSFMHSFSIFLFLLMCQDTKLMCVCVCAYMPFLLLLRFGTDENILTFTLELVRVCVLQREVGKREREEKK